MSAQARERGYEEGAQFVTAAADTQRQERADELAEQLVRFVEIVVTVSGCSRTGNSSVTERI